MLIDDDVDDDDDDDDGNADDDFVSMMCTFFQLPAVLSLHPTVTHRFTLTINDKTVANNKKTPVARVGHRTA